MSNVREWSEEFNLGQGDPLSISYEMKRWLFQLCVQCCCCIYHIDKLVSRILLHGTQPKPIVIVIKLLLCAAEQTEGIGQVFTLPSSSLCVLKTMSGVRGGVSSLIL